MAKTWTEKFENANKNLPKVTKLDDKLSKRYNGASTMLVPSAGIILELMSSIPLGRLITVAEIRNLLAKKYAVDVTCPLTTGIFIWIAANYAQEQADKNGKEPIPFWRTLKSKGELVAKYPGGMEMHKQYLEAEGFSVIRKGKKYYVEGYSEYIEPIV